MQSHVQLAIGSRLENVELAQLVVEQTLAELDLGVDLAYEVGMAVREAVANAIHHGNEADPGKRVVIDFGFEDGEVVVIVTDQGKGFDPERVRDPLTGKNLLRPNGRGLLFMREFMDRIDYTFDADGGTIVTLRKRLHQADESVTDKENQK
jgi:serine/threonine-protein kinase RsbW